MALRVLLADESSTIKKVFQLALQDYAVEVKPVALGVDVQAVAADFQPDIIFADILLQKKNGYEVCADMKADAQLRSIPIVLMWSGFMELDQDKFDACAADGRLEKPFDVAQLRKVVQDLVPKTKTQSLSNYLEFPDVPKEEQQSAPSPSAPPQREETSLEAEETEDADDFHPVSIPALGAKNEKFQVSDEEEDGAEFVMKTAASIDVNGLQEEDAQQQEAEEEAQTQPAIPVPVEMANENEAEDDGLEVDFSHNEEEENFSFRHPGKTVVRPANSFDLKPEEVREIVERLAPKIIEEIAWKVVPELATQIIERELKSLLAEKESTLS